MPKIMKKRVKNDDFDDPRPVPKATPTAVKAPPVEPTVPELSIMVSEDPASGFYVLQSALGQHNTSSDATSHSTGAIPKKVTSAVANEFNGPGITTNDSPDLDFLRKFGRIVHNDPNTPFVIIDAGPIDECFEQSRESKSVVKIPGNTNEKMSNKCLGASLTALNAPPLPTVFQPPLVQPAVPELSVLFDSNNNESLVPPKSACDTTNICKYPQFYAYSAKLEKSIKQPKMQFQMQSPKIEANRNIIIKHNRSVQTKPNVCDKYTQVQVQRRPPLKLRSDKTSSLGKNAIGDGENIVTSPTKDSKGSIDSLNDPKERQLTREMVFKALDELNCIFEMPRPATSKSETESDDSFNAGISDESTNPNKLTCRKIKRANEGKAEGRKCECKDQKEVKPTDYSNSKDRSLAMKELAAKYLPKWKQKLLFEDKIPLDTPKPESCKITKENVTENETKRLIHQIKSMKIDQVGYTDNSGECYTDHTQPYTATRIAGGRMPSGKRKNTKCYNKQNDMRLFQRTMGDKIVGDQTVRDDDLKRICDIPMALCREEKELLKAFRENKTIFVFK